MEWSAASTGESDGTDDDLTAACSWCGSTDVEYMAMYGAQLLTDQYRCNDCRNYFGTILKR